MIRWFGRTIPILRLHADETECNRSEIGRPRVLTASDRLWLVHMSTIDKIARAARLESALLVSRMLLAGRDDQKPTQDGRQRHCGTGHTKAELHCWAPGNRPPLTRSPPVHPASHTAARAARRATRKQVEYSRLATAHWPSCSWQHDASSTFFSGDSFSSSSNVYQRSPPPRRAPSTRATPPSHHAAPVLVLHLHRGVTVSVAHQSQHQEQQQLGLQRHSAHRRAPQRASPNVESSQLAPHLASPSGEMSSWMVPRADQPETLLLRVLHEGDGPRKDDHPLPPREAVLEVVPHSSPRPHTVLLSSLALPTGSHDGGMSVVIAGIARRQLQEQLEQIGAGCMTAAPRAITPMLDEHDEASAPAGAPVQEENAKEKHVVWASCAPAGDRQNRRPSSASHARCSSRAGHFC